MRPTDKAYNCDRCGEHTPDGEGRYYEDDRLCADCAEVVAFWQTIEHDDEIDKLNQERTAQ